MDGQHSRVALGRCSKLRDCSSLICRTGWLEDEACKPTGRLEYRPAAELGPVIVCLDTSGSMSGARETVAKVIVSETLPQRPYSARKEFQASLHGNCCWHSDSCLNVG